MSFDGHCDIWTDITHHYLAGETDNFRRYHYDRLKKGEIEGGIFVIWNDPPFEKTPFERVREMMDAIAHEEKDCADIMTVARSYADMTAARNEKKMYAFIGLEGLECVGEDLDLIDEFYRFGARHAGLTWNEENLLATGVRGTTGRGLTALGRQAVKKIQNLGMLLDVSHLNDESFWDLMRAANGPVIASHSNCRALCNKPRNLTDEQIREIGNSGGLIGLNAFSEFVHDDAGKQTVETLVSHLVHMVELIGIEHVGFGFDFSEYLSGNTLSLYASQENVSTTGLEDASKVPNVIREMRRVGFTEDEIAKVTYQNWHRVIREVIK